MQDTNNLLLRRKTSTNGGAPQEEEEETTTTGGGGRGGDLYHDGFVADSGLQRLMQGLELTGDETYSNNRCDMSVVVSAGEQQ